MAPRHKPQARPTEARKALTGRPTRRAAPAPAPRPMDPSVARAGRQAAIVLVGTGLFWILATWAGGALGLSQRLRALFDLFALAGFGLALWMTFQVWRKRPTQVE